MKWLWLGIGAGLVLTFITLAAWIHSVTNRRWAELEALRDQLLADVKARDPRRPLLRGTPTPGDAWADYSAALGGIGPADLDLLRPFVSRGRTADPGKVRALVDSRLRVLDLLASGASRENAVYPIDWSGGFHARLPHLTSANRLIFLAVARARLLRDSGRSADSTAVLLDALQFAGDMGRNTYLIGSATSANLVEMVFEELREIPPDPVIARALGIWDGGLGDPAADLLNESVGICATACRGDADLDTLFHDTTAISLGSWRYGFSRRLMAADAILAQHAELLRMAAAMRSSWREVKREETRVQSLATSSPNPMLRLMLPGNVTSLDPFLRGRRAQLRLLRRHHGETSELEDPFGGRIRSEGRKIWSVGQDGVDDGGQGAWKPGNTGDIVLDPTPK